jgi:hypothetical protein
MIWMKTMHQRNFKSINGAKRSRIRWKYLAMAKNWLGERRHRFLGCWFHPITPRFHRGTKGSPMGVLGSPSRLFLSEREREREVKKPLRGKFCLGGLNPQKLDISVSETGQSDLSWTTKNSYWGARNSDMPGSGLDMSRPPLWKPAWGPDMSDPWLSHWGIWLGWTCPGRGPDMSRKHPWNPAWEPVMLGWLRKRLRCQICLGSGPDMSGQSLWNPARRPDTSGLTQVFGGRIDFWYFALHQLTKCIPLPLLSIAKSSHDHIDQDG